MASKRLDERRAHFTDENEIPELRTRAHARNFQTSGMCMYNSGYYSTMSESFDIATPHPPALPPIRTIGSLDNMHASSIPLPGNAIRTSEPVSAPHRALPTTGLPELTSELERATEPWPISQDAHDEAVNLVVQVPDHLNGDSLRTRSFIVNIQHKYAAFRTQEIISDIACNHFTEYSTERAMGKQSVPADVQEEHNWHLRRREYCKQSLNKLRMLAAGGRHLAERNTTPYSPFHETFAGRNVINQHQANEGQSTILQTSAPWPIEPRDPLATVVPPFIRHNPSRWSGCQPPFDRTEQGALRKPVLTSRELRDFFIHHFPDDVPFSLWIQKTPNLPAGASLQSPAIHRCRFQTCVFQDQSGMILPSEIRVALDESSYTGLGANPKRIVGYVHLFCLERKFHLPGLFQSFPADIESFEEYKGLSPGDSPGFEPGPLFDLTKLFLLGCKAPPQAPGEELKRSFPDYPRTENREILPRGFKDRVTLTLTYRMQLAHEQAMATAHAPSVQQIGGTARAPSSQQTSNFINMPSNQQPTLGSRKTVLLGEQQKAKSSLPKAIRTSMGTGMPESERAGQAHQFGRRLPAPDPIGQPSNSLLSAEREKRTLELLGGEYSKFDPRRLRYLDASQVASNVPVPPVPPVPSPFANNSTAPPVPPVPSSFANNSTKPPRIPTKDTKRKLGRANIVNPEVDDDGDFDMGDGFPEPPTTRQPARGASKARPGPVKNSKAGDQTLKEKIKLAKREMEIRRRAKEIAAIPTYPISPTVPSFLNPPTLSSNDVPSEDFKVKNDDPGKFFKEIVGHFRNNSGELRYLVNWYDIHDKQSDEPEDSFSGIGDQMLQDYREKHGLNDAAGGPSGNEGASMSDTQAKFTSTSEARKESVKGQQRDDDNTPDTGLGTIKTRGENIGVTADEGLVELSKKYLDEMLEMTEAEGDPNEPEDDEL